MGIRNNGGGGARASAGSGDMSSSGENSSVWVGFIFEGDWFSGSVIEIVIVHIVSF